MLPIKVNLEFVVLITLVPGESEYQAAGFLTYVDAWQWARTMSQNISAEGVLYKVVRVYNGEVMSSYRNGWLETF